MRYFSLTAAGKQAIHLKKALEINPKDAYDWHDRGDVLRTISRFEEALKAYDEAIKLDPDYAPSWSDKGFTLRQLNRYEEALSAYDAATKRNHSSASMK